MTDQTSPSEVPKSIFGDLKRKHDEISASLKLTKRIPHWEDPEIFAIYRPLGVEEFEAITKKNDNKKDPRYSKKALNNAMDSLSLACIEVYGVIDGTEYSFGPDPHGARTRFDADMATTIDLEDKSVRSLLRYLYPVDGDLLNAANALMKFSEIGNDMTDDDYAGE